MSKRNTSSIYFDGSFDSFGPVRKFVGDNNLLIMHLDSDPERSYVMIHNDLCDATVRQGESITKDQHGKFSVKKSKSKKGYAGDL